MAASFHFIRRLGCFIYRLVSRGKAAWLQRLGLADTGRDTVYFDLPARAVSPSALLTLLRRS